MKQILIRCFTERVIESRKGKHLSLRQFKIDGILNGQSISIAKYERRLRLRGREGWLDGEGQDCQLIQKESGTAFPDAFATVGRQQTIRDLSGPVSGDDNTVSGDKAAEKADRPG